MEVYRNVAYLDLIAGCLPQGALDENAIDLGAKLLVPICTY